MKYVVRAGGTGSRLWPYSRLNRPKQFHAMTGEQTMLQEAVGRLRPIAAPEEIFVSTGAGIESLVRTQLPELPAANLIIEPALRDTGAAVGLECTLLEARFPGCTVASLGSDHYVGKPDRLCHLLEAADQFLQNRPECLLTLGVTPTRVESGYGHIRKGDQLALEKDVPVFSVREFTEKPDIETARTFTESGDYLWNSNLFAWKAATMLGLFERFEPEMFGGLARIGEVAKSGDPAAVAEAIEQVYPTLKSIAVDNAIIERAEQVATMEADIDWGDIGSWAALTDVLDPDKNENLMSGEVLAIDSKGVTAYGRKDKLIALLGVEDLVVVDTPDALLVCHKDQAQRLREVWEQLRSQKKYDRYT